MGAIKPLDKTVLDNASFLKNEFNFEAKEIIKNLPIYTGTLNCKKMLPKQSL